MRKKRSDDMLLGGDASGFSGDGLTIITEDRNAFGDSVREGHRIDPRGQKVFVLAVLLVVMYAAAPFIPQGIVKGVISGTASFSLVISWMQRQVEGFTMMFVAGDFGFVEHMAAFAVIVATGAGLALSGAVYQGSFRNALVSPSTLGVMSGATLGLTLWIFLFYFEDIGPVLPGPLQQIQFASEYEYTRFWYACISGAAFVGCLIVVSIVLLTMRLAGSKQTSSILIIITGQVIAAIIGAVTGAIRYYVLTTMPNSNKAELLTDYTVQSFFREYSWVDVACIAVPLVVTFVVVMRLRQRMMLLSFNEAEARTMGVDARRMQVVVIMLCTLLTAVIVSFCGAVGFVGFLVPHLARRMVGPNFKYLLPASVVLGGLFVLGAYMVLFFIGFDGTMTGVFISTLGSVVFLVTALRGRGSANGQFR